MIKFEVNSKRSEGGYEVSCTGEINGPSNAVVVEVKALFEAVLEKIDEIDQIRVISYVINEFCSLD